MELIPLSRFDLHQCVARLPKSVMEAMKKHGKNMVVAGGYIRAVISGEFINDIDFFSPNKDIALTVAASLKKERPLIVTDNAVTVLGHKLPLQFIHRWTFAEPEAVIPSFDFTIARAAFWYEPDIRGEGGAITNPGKWHGVCDPHFYQDLAAKRLVYCSPEREEEAGGSMLRILKFYQRGYRIPLDSLGRVMGRMVRGIKPVNFEKLQAFQGESWHGKEFNDWADQIGMVFTGLLREVDPMIDPDHIAHLPSIEETKPE